MGKTSKEWFEQLPEPHKVWCIRESKDLEEIVDSLHDAIFRCWWNKSSQGNDYWVRLHQSAKAGDFGKKSIEYVHGAEFTAEINRKYCEGKVHVSSQGVFLCNDTNGSEWGLKNTFGYSQQWRIVDQDGDPNSDFYHVRKLIIKNNEIPKKNPTRQRIQGQRFSKRKIKIKSGSRPSGMQTTTGRSRTKIRRSEISGRRLFLDGDRGNDG